MRSLDETPTDRGADPTFRLASPGYRRAVTRTLADRYVLGDPIARGGTARVHEAIDTRLGRRVAVKLLDLDLAETADPAGRARFLQECRTSAGFTHPRAVTVFDAGEDGDDLFLVMELVEGPSLARHLADRGPLPLADVVRIATQLADALGAAHEAGLVHRDVKPANVLLDPSGDVKLADFGIARRFDDLETAVTTTGLVVGTPRYLAPEQAAGGRVGPPADVHALGLVILELLTGRPTVAADIGQVRHGRPELPDHLADLIESMLATDPADRPTDATVVARALRRPSDVRTDGGRSAPESSPQAIVEDIRGSDTAAIATTVLPSQHTAVMPAKPTTGRSSRRRGTALVAPLIAVAGLAAILIVGIALGDDAPPIDPADAATVVDTDGDEDALDAEPERDADPAEADTVAEPDEATLAEFATVWNLHEFTLELERDASPAGPAGAELAQRLREVIETSPRPRQAVAAAELRDRIESWTEVGDLHGGFGVIALDLLEPVADHPAARR